MQVVLGLGQLFVYICVICVLGRVGFVYVFQDLANEFLLVLGESSVWLIFSTNHEEQCFSG